MAANYTLGIVKGWAGQWSGGGFGRASAKECKGVNGEEYGEDEAAQH